jgi:hypothetical protein
MSGGFNYSSSLQSRPQPDRTQSRKGVSVVCSLNFANINDGTLVQRTIGEFKNGRGEFFNQDIFNGRAILVRFVISDITPTSCRFEQSFSDDESRSREVSTTSR